MKNIESSHFHKFYGVKKQRITYQKKDFIDYVIMNIICAFIIYFSYGADQLIAKVGLVLCAFMIGVFPIRHGIKLGIPIILKKPQEILYLLIHKIQNIKLPFLVAIGVLLIENYIIYLTPNLPHKVELANKIAIILFYSHLVLITIYRTVILFSHLLKRELVKEILMQSIWKQHLDRQPSITLEIVHAYLTGVLTHIVYLVPWYLVIKYFNFSLVLFPLSCLAAILIQQRFIKVINEWFYRDHWLGHNSEIEFVYLHGPHHDAIPSGLIGVAGNGALEGFYRGVIGFPIAFFNPVMAALFYTTDVKIDIDSHQYIPGIFPKLSKGVHEVTQHSTHHFGRVEPYGFAIKLDQPGLSLSEDTKKRFKFFPNELKNSIDLDEQLTGYKWDNTRHKWFLDLVDKYQSNDSEAVVPLTQNEKE